MRRVERFASVGRAERIGRGNGCLLAQLLPVLGPAPRFAHLAAAALLAGLLIGIAEALPALFMGAAAVLLPANLVMPLPRSAPSDPIQIALVAVVGLSLETAASAAFGLCVWQRVRGGSRRRVIIASFAAFLLLQAVALVVAFRLAHLLDLLARPIGIAAVPTWINYAVTFSLLTFAVAGTFTLAVGRAARTLHLGRRALATATVASLVFALVVLLLDPLPGWHVGGGQQAMPKVTLVANFAAGTIGGATCFILLTGSPGNRHGDG